MTWVLHICIAATWAGCGAFVTHEYPSEQACYMALREAVKEPRVSMWCAPKRGARNE